MEWNSWNPFPFNWFLTSEINSPKSESTLSPFFNKCLGRKCSSNFRSSQLEIGFKCNSLTLKWNGSLGEKDSDWSDRPTADVTPPLIESCPNHTVASSPVSAMMIFWKKSNWCLILETEINKNSFKHCI